MAQNIEQAPRYFWKSYELSKAQYQAARDLGADDVFVETPAHLRDDEFIRSAWK